MNRFVGNLRRLAETTSWPKLWTALAASVALLAGGITWAAVL
ncbi:MAG: hypothetical protein ACKOD3_05100 [Phenylobacterium sp.]